MNRRIVIGTWSMSGDWGPIDLNEIIDVLEKAYYEYGFEEFDTAPNYGNGFSEFLLGKIFYNEKNILINTKVGSKPFCGKAFDLDWIKLSIEQSLYRLNRDSINVLFLHNPRNEITDYDKILALLYQYKSQGTIKKIGLSCAKGFDYSNYVELSAFDYIQDDINLLALSSLNKEQDLYYYARSPLANGILGGDINMHTTFPDSDHRSTWLKGKRLHSILKRVKELENVCENGIADLALRFLIHNPNIYKVIFGIRKINHLINIVELLKTQPLDDDKIFKIHELFKNDYGLIDEKILSY